MVNLIAFYEDDTKFYLVMELMTGGELFQRIVQKSKYTESEARDLVRTLTMAVNYCHEQGVMHRDLKVRQASPSSNHPSLPTSSLPPPPFLHDDAQPENVLLASKDEDAEVKLADFGFAKKFHYESEHAFQTSCGTPGYTDNTTNTHHAPKPHQAYLPHPPSSGAVLLPSPGMWRQRSLARQSMDGR